MKKYFYDNGKEKQGPFSFEELKDKDIKKETLIWFQGLENWKPAEKVKEIEGILGLEPVPVNKHDFSSNLGLNNTNEKVQRLGNSQGNEIPYLKGFRFFRILCIILGALGILGTIFLLMTENPVLSNALKESNHSILASYFNLLCFMGLTFGAIFIFKLRQYGRILILTSLILSFIQLIINTINTLKAGIFFPNVIIVSIIVNIILYAILIEYFYNPRVKKFILETHLFKYKKMIPIDVISEAQIKKWITIKYIWRTFIIASVYSIMNPILEPGVYAFIIHVISFIIASLFIAGLVRLIRYLVFKKQDNFAIILFYTTIVMFLSNVFSFLYL